MLAFVTALSALSRTARDKTTAEDGALRLPVIQAVLTQCEAAGEESFGRLIALLRRFEGDAAREMGRRGVERMQREAPAAQETRIETRIEPRVEPELAPAPVVEPEFVPDLAAFERALMTDPEAQDMAPAVAPEAPVTADAGAEITIDFIALEKELIAA
jgi:hypothetical protein